MVDYDAVGHVSSSSYRMKTLEKLTERPQTPKEIHEGTGISLSHTSRTLTELREYDLIELLVDEDRSKGRYYDTTEKGEDVLEVAQAHA